MQKRNFVFKMKALAVKSAYVKLNEVADEVNTKLDKSLGLQGYIFDTDQ